MHPGVRKAHPRGPSSRSTRPRMCGGPGAYGCISSTRVEPRRGKIEEEREMILATTKVEDVDRFLKIFSTKGAEKRQQHGSKGSTVFRDPSEENSVWVLFDWDAEGWQSF